ncbi:GWxTD domain-containing protein [bacterium]|nr:GWxTD domain-containing protein [bacterium]
MYKKRIKCRFRATLLLFCSAYSLILSNSVAGVFAEDQKPLRLSVDVAKFQGDSSHTKIEVCQSINRQGLTYKKRRLGFIARFELETKILQQDSLVVQQNIAEADTVYDLGRIEPGQQFVYVLPFFLRPGRYQILTVLHDLNDDRRSSNRIPLDMALFPGDSLVLSDIQFASHIEKSSNFSSPFVKNNLHVMPNPQALYGDGLENLTFYAEVYNLDFAAENMSTYNVDYIIENADGKVLSRIRGRERSKQSKDAAIYTSFDISGLKSNRYLLKLEVTDASTKRRTYASKRFSIFRRADALISQADQERKMYQGLDEATLQNYFDQISYIATDEERDTFKQLEPQGKREFLFQFWQGRDPFPDTPENEFKEDYIERLVKAKVNFSFSETEGWRTDRGRIFLIYGAPDFIDREPALSSQNAHEIWTYEMIEGRRAIFVFIDLNANGQFRLMHSDYRDEISNPNWESYLYK